MKMTIGEEQIKSIEKDLRQNPSSRHAHDGLNLLKKWQEEDDCNIWELSVENRALIDKIVEEFDNQ